MRIFVINLDRATDRLDHMTAELTRCGVDFERISATDRLSLPDDFVSEICRRKNICPLDPGTIACFMSHRAAWQRLLDSGEERALILEDDLIFGEDAKLFLRSDDWIPRDLADGIIRLETFLSVTAMRREPVFHAHGRSFHRQTIKHFGSAAYVLSRALAQRLLDASPEITTEVDDFLFEPREGRPGAAWPVYQAWPAVFVQEGIRSRHDSAPTTMPSDINLTRRHRRKAMSRFMDRQVNSLKKRYNRLRGYLLDPIRGEKTGIVPFR